MNSLTPTYVKPGDVVTIELPYSEVCAWMRVAGKRMQVRFEQSRYMNGTPAPGYVAQILNDSGSEFSFPILPGEAGFYQDADGAHYTYLPARHLTLVA